MPLRVAVAGGTGVVGRYAVAEADRRGHVARALSRSENVDLLRPESLAPALEGIDVIIDVSNPETTEQEPATEFFMTVAENLQSVGAAQKVRHLIALSIIGIDRVPIGYYAAKLAQEQAVAVGSVPSTILRASPFHEFAAQIVSWTRDGSRAKVLDLRLQTVAARTVGSVLVDIAEGQPAGRSTDLAGPDAADLVALSRKLVEHREVDLVIDPDVAGIEGGCRDAFMPDDSARIAGPAFDEWLASEDSLSVSL